MALSRLRLRLTASYAVGFFAVLIVLNLAVVRSVRQFAQESLTRRLTAAASGVLVEIPREFNERPDSGWAKAARATLDEWPAGADALVVYGGNGARLATLGASTLIAASPQDVAKLEELPPDTGAAPNQRTRRVLVRGPPPLTVVAAGSLDDALEPATVLGGWLLRLTPLLLLASLLLGYLFAGRALAPMNALAARIARLAPDQLDQALPVRTPPDEIDRIALQFNGLLSRLEGARTRNRRFVQRAAHQIRTPLTLLLGEASLQRSGAPDPAESRRAIDRIWISAHQMQRRVDELVTWAAAEAGEAPPMGDSIELDALALEATDLMRHRASVLGHPLELLQVEAVTVPGNAALLREALVELLENACRHGEAGVPVSVRVLRTADHAEVTVLNRGSAVDIPEVRVDELPEDGRGLGLSIVRWIAEQHQGRLDIAREVDRNAITLVLPLTQ